MPDTSTHYGVPPICREGETIAEAHARRRDDPGPEYPFVPEVVTWASLRPHSDAARRELAEADRAADEQELSFRETPSALSVWEWRLIFARRWAGRWAAETRGEIKDHPDGGPYPVLDSEGRQLDADPEAFRAADLFGAETVEEIRSTVRIVELAEIEPPSPTARSHARASIETLGFNDTPNLSPIPEAERRAGCPYLYRVIDGERRVADALDLGLDRIPALVADRPLGETTAAALRLAKNVARGVNYVREAESIRTLQKTLTDTEIARRLGVSRATIDNRRRLLEVPERILEGVASGDVSPTAASRLSTLGEDLVGRAVEILNTTGRLRMKDVKALTRERREDAIEALPDGLFGALPDGPAAPSEPVEDPAAELARAARAYLASGGTVTAARSILKTAYADLSAEA